MRRENCICYGMQARWILVRNGFIFRGAWMVSAGPRNWVFRQLRWAWITHFPQSLLAARVMSALPGWISETIHIGMFITRHLPMGARPGQKRAHFRPTSPDTVTSSVMASDFRSAIISISRLIISTTPRHAGEKDITGLLRAPSGTRGS